MVATTFGKEESAASQVLGALGAAFSAYALYPNATQQPVFARSIETLTQAMLPMTFEVGAGNFLLRGETVESSRDGVERLAKRLYIHDVEVFRIVSAPRPSDLVEFFSVIAQEDEVVRGNNGIYSMLVDAGVGTIATRQRGLLDAWDDDDEDPVEVSGESADDAEVPDPFAVGDPAAFADALMQATGEPEAISLEFMTQYRMASERLDIDDLNEQEAIVRKHADAFFYLPQEAQVDLLGDLLEQTQDIEPDPTVLMLLDQFSGLDLAELAPILSQDSFANLLAYARVADDAEARPEELLRLLQTSDDVKEAREFVAGRMSKLLQHPEQAIDNSDEAFASIRSQLGDRNDPFELGLRVLRGLFEAEDRNHRFLRVARIWAGRISRAVKEREYDRAEALLGVIAEPKPYSPDRQDRVDEALSRVLTKDLLTSVVEAIADGDDVDVVMGMLSQFGAVAVPKVIEQLADEENSLHRRILIDLLAAAARQNPQSVVEHLDDPRWFVVRNLAIALGKTGRPQTVSSLRRLLGHGDFRVRIEALRALVPVLGSGAADVLIGALNDDHERVRQTAITLLGANPAAEPHLIDAVEDDDVRAEERIKMIDVLAQDMSSEARQALERLASRRFTMSGGIRAVRDAAREALRTDGS